jgi:1-acyl-sn-glycerol-3-phosphate acyltransferase
MKRESFPQGGSEPAEYTFNRGSSPRLMRALEAQVKFLFGDIEVVGTENLKKLNPKTKFIFATTHTSDNDVPLVAATLGHDFDLVISDMSIHRSTRKALQAMDPTIIGLKIAGKDNFLPVSYSQKKEKTPGKKAKEVVREGRINAGDALAVKTALDNGKTVVIAAHNRSEGRLSSSPGYLAVRAAQITENAVVIPIAVQIGEPAEILGIGDPKNILETRRKKPNVKITIGEPLEFDDQITRLAGDRIEQILQDGAIPRGRVLAKATRVFRMDGERLMRALASLFPVEKKGRWQEIDTDMVENASQNKEKSAFEQKTLPELATEFMAVTDIMVKRRHDAIEKLMQRDGVSITEAFDNPDSEAAKAYEFYETVFGAKESEIANEFLGWNISRNNQDTELAILWPGAMCFVYPYHNEAEGKDMRRYEIMHVNREGELEAIYIEHDGKIDIDEYLTDENLEKMGHEERVGVNFVPLDLQGSDELVHALKVVKRWTGELLYGIDPQPDEPI